MIGFYTSSFNEVPSLKSASVSILGPAAKCSLSAEYAGEVTQQLHFVCQIPDTAKISRIIATDFNNPYKFTDGNNKQLKLFSYTIMQLLTRRSLPGTTTICIRIPRTLASVSLHIIVEYITMAFANGEYIPCVLPPSIAENKIRCSLKVGSEFYYQKSPKIAVHTLEDFMKVVIAQKEAAPYIITPYYDITSEISSIFGVLYMYYPTSKVYVLVSLQETNLNSILESNISKVFGYLEKNCDIIMVCQHENEKIVNGMSLNLKGLNSSKEYVSKYSYSINCKYIIITDQCSQLLGNSALQQNIYIIECSLHPISNPHILHFNKPMCNDELFEAAYQIANPIPLKSSLMSLSHSEVKEESTQRNQVVKYITFDPKQTIDFNLLYRTGEETIFNASVVIDRQNGVSNSDIELLFPTTKQIYSFQNILSLVLNNNNMHHHVLDCYIFNSSDRWSIYDEVSSQLNQLQLEYPLKCDNNLMNILSRLDCNGIWEFKREIYLMLGQKQILAPFQYDQIIREYLQSQVKISKKQVRKLLKKYIKCSNLEEFS